MYVTSKLGQSHENGVENAQLSGGKIMQFESSFLHSLGERKNTGQHQGFCYRQIIAHPYTDSHDFSRDLKMQNQRSCLTLTAPMSPLSDALASPPRPFWRDKRYRGGNQLYKLFFTEQQTNCLNMSRGTLLWWVCIIFHCVWESWVCFSAFFFSKSGRQ